MYKNAWTTVAAAAVLLVGAAGCTDLVVEPRSSASGETVFSDPGAYRGLLAKVYAGLAVTGQQGQGGAGAPDIAGIDEGFSQYLRLLWKMQQLPTDETVLGWGDDGIPEINRHEWTPTNQFMVAMYYRIFFQAVMANEFLRETTDEKLTQRNVGAAQRAQIAQYRAEARFLRALSYWHGIDLFGNIPLVTDAHALGSTPPAQATRQELFTFVVGELTEIRDQLPPVPQYGRAGRAAADMLLAKLHLNAQVYTGQAQWNEARAAAERVIASGQYQLAPTYMLNFGADNHISPEIVFPIPFDGMRTRTWGGMTFLVNAAIGGSMRSADYGVGGGWWGLRVTPQFVALFPGVTGPDRRASILYTQGHTLEIANLGDFSHGYAAPKYRNVTSTGQAGSHGDHPDTDFPMFRLADAYLMYAEAVLRGGGGSAAQALDYVNQIRQRAYGGAAGHITAGQLTLDFILDERARELFWEGHRRTDLIRFGRFTGGAKVWAWKGGTPAGTATSAHLDLYPLPASELMSNNRLTQNPGY
jgi:starch-binding outer membrane protein, SusD/RagB family